MAPFSYTYLQTVESYSNPQSPDYACFRRVSILGVRQKEKIKCVSTGLGHLHMVSPLNDPPLEVFSERLPAQNKARAAEMAAYVTRGDRDMYSNEVSLSHNRFWASPPPKSTHLRDSHCCPGHPASAATQDFLAGTLCATTPTMTGQRFGQARTLSLPGTTRLVLRTSLAGSVCDRYLWRVPHA